MLLARAENTVNSLLIVPNDVLVVTETSFSKTPDLPSKLRTVPLCVQVIIGIGTPIASQVNTMLCISILTLILVGLVMMIGPTIGYK